MEHLVADEPGEKLALQGPRYNLSIERVDGRISVVRHSFIGRSRERVIPLGKLQGIEIEADDAPALSLNNLGAIVRNALAAAQEKDLQNPEALADRLPKALSLRLLTIDERGKNEVFELNLSVAGVTDRQAVVEFAFKLAAVAGLVLGVVYAIPQVGLDIRLAREGEQGAPLLPARLSARDLASDASKALAKSGPPPFDHQRFPCDHQVLEWQPGKRVVFRRPFSKGAVVLLPFTLLIFLGPVLYPTALLLGGSLNPVTLGVATLFGLLVGGIAALILTSLLPRTVALDWSTRRLEISTWLRSKGVPFDRISVLELAAVRHEASGGDSGSGTITFHCELRALCKGPLGAQPKAVALISTKSMASPVEPLRRALPLLNELAVALGVEDRFKDYDFRS